MSGNHAATRGWIGLRRFSDSGGAFVWLGTGHSPKYVNWETRAPDNHGCDEDCVVMNAATGKWDDVSCSELASCSCQIFIASSGTASATIAASPTKEQETLYAVLAVLGVVLLLLLLSVVRYLQKWSTKSKTKPVAIEKRETFMRTLGTVGLVVGSATVWLENVMSPFNSLQEHRANCLQK